MGMLDSLNPINLVKSAAESIVDSVLPDSLKAVGNDLVDAALDVVGGNYAALGNDASALLKDGEAAFGPLTTLADSMSAGTTEPDAPPPANPTATAQTAPCAPKPVTTSEMAPVNIPLVTDGPGTTSPTATSAPATASPATPVVSPNANTTSTSATDLAAAAVVSPTATASTLTATAPTTTSSTTSSSASKDITKFFAQSDTDLMAAVRNGKLPDAVKDDPAAMQQLQLRMNEISEMNQLISQMLAAMHDMNKAVIQNIRA